MATNISNPSSDRNEKIDVAVDIIGKSKQNLEFFNAIYSNQKQIKTLQDVISNSTLKTPIRVNQIAKKFTTHDVVEEIKDPNNKKKYAFRKIPFYEQNKKTIINIVKNPKQKEKLSTRSRPKISISISNRNEVKDFFKIMPITINDIDSFKKVEKIKKVELISPFEADTKKLIQKILDEKGKFTDWGGETDDLFTTNLVIKKKRYHAAFALKGRGTKGMLTPNKMGKNGDQIPRLFKSPAQVLMIQYNGQISEDCVGLMKELAIAKSAKERKKIFYGIIDGTDTAKLFKAYS